MASLKILLVVLLGVLGGVVFHVLRTNGVILYTFVENGAEYKCEYVTKDEPVVGPEDFARISDNVLITVSDYKLELEFCDYPEFGPHNIPNGGLYAIFTDEKRAQRLNLVGYPEKTDFRPHGIYYDDKTNLLWVINHAFYKGGERVDRFEINYDASARVVSARYADSTYFDSQVYNGALNDLIAISNETFFITKFLIYSQPILGNGAEGPDKGLKTTLFRLAGLKYSYVLYCEYRANKASICEQLDVTASVLNNGISWDRKKQILINDVFLKSTRVFELNLKAKSRQDLLVPKGEISVSGCPDQIEYDDKRNVYYVAGSLRLHDLLQYIDAFKAAGAERPDVFSYGVFVDEIDANTLTAKNIFARNDTIKTCSAAYKTDANTIVLGSFGDKSLQICTAPGKK